MIEKKHKALASVYLVNDLVASCLAMICAWFLRFETGLIPVTKGSQEITAYALLLPLVALVFPSAFAVQGLYRIRPARGRVEEAVSVAMGSVVATIILSGILLWVRPAQSHIVPYSRATLALFVVTSIILTILGRTIVRSVVVNRHRAGKDLDRVLIAGNGELAREVYERMAHQANQLGFRVAGYLRNGDAGEIPGLPCLGTIAEAEAVVRRERIDHVFVALPHASSQAMMELLDRLVRSCLSIHVVPDLLQFMVLRSRVEDLDGLPTINLSETPLEGWSRFVKRAFDLVVATGALVFFSPLMLLVAIAIWLEDRGPIFYRQMRMGLDGKPFRIVKFRSMRVGAEAETGAVWAEKDDPRRTRVGRFIRAWSIDELPQLWNVLVGDMSVIGPRPERPEFVEQFRAEFPHYMLRHKVRAGMTGWAQVHGWRGNTSIRMRIEHDLYYIENWSLLLDCKILFMTVLHGLRHENAY
ncbi:MAG TPA: undecaprenyl-phosphate glucose phosphotransferase [Thermoanaerobaculia bacterium]|jgi:exopolysaccharide biosynthesis polyprenyl glycosylphosphotransferase